LSGGCTDRQSKVSLESDGVCVSVVGDDDQTPIARVKFVLRPVIASYGFWSIVGD
jgi:hypothetical protein